MANACERVMFVIVVVMGVVRTAANEGELKSGVPCRHLMSDVSAGELGGNAEVKKIMPAVMPAKDNHEAF